MPPASSYVIIQQAEALFSIERFTDAERLIKDWLASNPGTAQVYTLLSIAITRQTGRADEAAHYAHLAISTDPSHPGGFYALTRLKEDKETRAALKTLDEALSRAPGQAHYHALKAHLYLSIKDYPNALAAVDQALRLAPEDVEAIQIRVAALYALNRVDEAQAAAEHGLRLDPQYYAMHNVLGWILLRKNELAAAREHFVESLRIKPTYDNAQDGLIKAGRAHYPFYHQALVCSTWWTYASPRMQTLIAVGGPLVILILGGRAVSQIYHTDSRLGWPALTVLFILVLFAAFPPLLELPYALLQRFDPKAVQIINPKVRLGLDALLAFLLMLTITNLVVVFAGETAAGLTCCGMIFIAYLVYVLPDDLRKRKQK